MRGVPEHPGNCISCALYVGDFLLEGCPNGPRVPMDPSLPYQSPDLSCGNFIVLLTNFDENVDF